jgi:hypothetical protein
MIVVTQRPSWVSRFVFSEADFFSVFHMNDRRDRKTIEEFVPIDLEKPLGEHHSHWFDVKNNTKFLLKPVPKEDTILEKFRQRLRGMKGWNGFI